MATRTGLCEGVSERKGVRIVKNEKRRNKYRKKWGKEFLFRLPLMLCWLSY